jgi:hypothetical protein
VTTQPTIVNINDSLNTHHQYISSAHESTHKTHSTWLTHLAAAHAVEDSATEDEVIEDAATVDVEGGDPDEEETNLKRRNGSQSPNSVDSSRLAKLQAWSKSICTLCPSRSTRSSTSSSPSSRTR